MRIRILSLFIVSLLGCSPDNVIEDISLKEVFEKNGFRGSFGLFDNGKGDFIIYNLHQFTDSLYSPASTFKIVNSLIGLETGITADTTSTVQTDDSALTRKENFKTGRSECDTILTMSQAFRLSCPNYYRELAQKIGVKTMQHYLDTLGYARKKGKFEITEKNLTQFWLNNEIKITADEQLGLVKRLYFDQLPFQKRTQRLLRGMMQQEETPTYKLGYKTGTTDMNLTGAEIGWLVGWIEENKHLFFFSLQVESKDHRDRSDRIKLLKDILQKKGFLKGVK